MTLTLWLSYGYIFETRIMYSIVSDANFELFCWLIHKGNYGPLDVQIRTVFTDSVTTIIYLQIFF